jgi:excinuclease UvrABC ATPase subunit
MPIISFDIGPEREKTGGTIVAQERLEELKNLEVSVTRQSFLSGKEIIDAPKKKAAKRQREVL